MSLNFKQQKFVDEYLVDCNATQAATRAGYSAKTAYSQGERLLRHVEIKAALTEKARGVSEQSGVDAAWIRTKLKLNVERALQETPVLDTQGRETGEYKYDGAVANRALELLGKDKLISMFEEKVALEVSRSPEERELRILELMEMARQRALPEPVES